MARKLKSKRAAHNMLRPLIFRNFFRNIQKIKNGLRIICYAPHSSKALLCPPSPRGEALEQGWTFFRIFALSKNEKGGRLYQRQLENKLRPSSVGFADSKPPRLPLGGNSARKAPQGEAFIDFKQFATVRYETPCGRVTKRAMLAPRGEGYIKGNYLKIQMVLYGLLVFQLPLISPLCGQLPPGGKPLS